MKLTFRLKGLMAAASLAVVPGIILAPSSSYGYGVGALGAATADSARGGTAAAPVIAISGSAPSQASVISASQASSADTTAAVVASTQTTSTSSSAPVASSRRSSGSSSTSTRTTSSYSSKEVVTKNPVVETAAPAGPEFAFTAGWDSQYMFKGLDNVRASSFGGRDESSIWYAKFSAAYEGFGFNLGYIMAAEESDPRFSPVERSEYYSEVVAGVNYTASIIGGVLDGTIGYNAYFFPEEDFWGTGYQGELYARLALVNIPFVTPNFVYSYFHSEEEILEGHFFEFRLDSSIPVYEGNGFKVAVNPYASISYDQDYNGVGGDWNSIETGVKVPISIGDHLIVALSGNYGWDIGDDRSNFDKGFDDFWGGVSVTYRF
ncbi:hypothetical protein DES53_106335 [Roseimicrobium gellanilyticum]|uniref:Uncharacterized protein n=1 Tax=Roseimicrobium gellanilyticum TaxID=748857 RepID=A0A366HIP1_9BACT|nr:hypothetical protein [Roseimicrobium gellanilyticum]RBP42626.1 hypothetical protein DES53_106335 [Roseimicrobium gellanilyticum]